MTAFDAIDFLERAVQTPSDADVGPMRDLLVAELESTGNDPLVDDAGNVLAERGSGTPHFVLNTHIDTVTPHVPFDRDDGVINGRGACDAKGPLAALMDAFLSTTAHVTLAITPDEETDSTGAAALDLDADGYIVGEPTGLDVCHAARGRFETTVTLTGANAHAAEPTTGINAVAAAEAVLGALSTFDETRGPGTHPELGSPTLTPTVIDGGEAPNQVPDRCELVLDRRSVPPETAAGYRSALEAHLRAAVPDTVGVTVALADRDAPFLEAFATDPDEPLVRTLREASGGTVRPFGAATEAAFFATDAPTVVFGPGELADDEGPVAHADREYVRVSEVHAAADAVRRTLAALS